VCVFDRLDLGVNVGQNLTDLRVALAGFGPLDTSVANDHVALPLAGVVSAHFARGMLVLTPTSVGPDG